MSVGLGLAFTKKADSLRKVAVIREASSTVRDSSAVYNFLENKCERNPVNGKEDYNWKLEIKNEKLGTSVFLFYELNWDDAMLLLKRGTINLILTGNDGHAQYHFDPLNSDAELTYLKLSNAIGSGNVIPEVKTAEIKASNH